MGFLGGMKSKLGFGDRPEWQTDEPDDYDDMAQQDDEYGDVIAFDDYNPDTFEHVRVRTDHKPAVARKPQRDLYGYSSVTSHSHGLPVAGGSVHEKPSNLRSMRAARTYKTQTTRHPLSSRATDEAQSTAWSTPEDPAFLDESVRPASYGREVLSDIGALHQNDNEGFAQGSDPLSQFDCELRQIKRDPGSHLEIVRPKVYGDVEKIATAAKAGKSVVLVLKATKPELSKRMLDFSFGVASALNKNVEKAADKIFVISKGSEMLTSDERSYLSERGIL